MSVPSMRERPAETSPANARGVQLHRRRASGEGIRKCTRRPLPAPATRASASWRSGVDRYGDGDGLGSTMGPLLKNHVINIAKEAFFKAFFCFCVRSQGVDDGPWRQNALLEASLLFVHVVSLFALNTTQQNIVTASSPPTLQLPMSVP